MAWFKCGSKILVITSTYSVQKRTLNVSRNVFREISSLDYKHTKIAGFNNRNTLFLVK